MESKNNLVKLGAAIKLKKTLKYYVGKEMNNDEKNLIKSIFVRKPHEQIEEKPIQEAQPF